MDVVAVDYFWGGGYLTADFVMKEIEGGAKESYYLSLPDILKKRKRNAILFTGFVCRISH